MWYELEGRWNAGHPAIPARLALRRNMEKCYRPRVRERRWKSRSTDVRSAGQSRRRSSQGIR